MESAGLRDGYAGRQRINTFVIRRRIRWNNNVIMNNMIWRTFMRIWPASLALQGRSTARLAGVILFAGVRTLLALAALFSVGVETAMAQPEAGGEAALKLPDLRDVSFLNGRIDGHNLLLIGILFCIFGLGFGLAIYMRLKNLPVHRAMREISELIYETCKTYLVTQGKFILVLWAFIAVIIAAYFGWLAPVPDKPVALTLPIILAFSLIGIAGSYGVAWFGIRVNTFANTRTAFASLPGKPYPVYQIPLEAGMSIGMMLISVELLIMLFILLFVPGDYAGPCFIGFAIGESLGAAALRIAGGIFTKIADIGSDLMKIVFKIKEDDARNPGVIADCTGDNAGDSVGPSADGFETYGVTGVALISFILLGVKDTTVQVQLLVWIFAMRILMIVTSVVSYLVNEAAARARYGGVDRMNFEAPLTSLVWLTSFVSVALTFAASYVLIPELGGDTTLWWKLSLIITCGTLAGAVIPELVKVFTSTSSAHVREIVTASREGGASLNVLAGLTAGNFSAFWMGIAIAALMAIGFAVSQTGLSHLMLAPAVFAFGLVAFGFLGMGPVTIAVDSYGPVTDNAQSVFELSVIEAQPGIKQELKKDFGFEVDFERAKHYLEENDGAGNTFKATAKPVLIGTAVVGATTMIFSIIMVLTDGLTANMQFLTILHAPFLLGLIVGGAVIYWFTGASIQAVSTGAFACLESYFFIGYLISIAIFGLYQAIFMADAGGAWDNAKKVVEVELKAKGTPLHAASVVGDTVGDPFKDTSSVAMNPIIKFTTLFGLLAVELATELQNSTRWMLAALFFGVALVFVWRSFYGMRIQAGVKEQRARQAQAA